MQRANPWALCEVTYPGQPPRDREEAAVPGVSHVLRVNLKDISEKLQCCICLELLKSAQCTPCAHRSVFVPAVQ